VHYPADYGYVENTIAEDGDEVDILILIDEPTFSGCLIEARPIGMLQMKDEKGIDNKVLAVLLLTLCGITSKIFMRYLPTCLQKLKISS